MKQEYKFKCPRYGGDHVTHLLPRVSGNGHEALYDIAGLVCQSCHHRWATLDAAINDGAYITHHKENK